MATKVFLHGHGGWEPSDGYTKVPKGCSVVFYAHFAKNLAGATVYPVLDGSYTGDTDRTIAQFGMVPNLTMASLTKGQHKQAIQTFSGTGAILHMLKPEPPEVVKHLSELMDECLQAYGAEIEFHWLCCQSLGLREQGGDKIGVNAADYTQLPGHEGYYLMQWTENGVDKEKWVKSESTMHR